MMALPQPTSAVEGRGAARRTSARLREAAASGALVAPGTILLVVMVAVPVLVLIWFSMLETTEQPGELSLQNYSRLLDNPLYLKLFLKSVLVATTVGFVTIMLAWPAAWALSRIDPARRQMLLSLIIVPYLTSLLLLIYAVFVLLGPGGPLMSVLELIGVASSDSSVIYTNKATLIMLVYENLPIMIVVLYSASERIDNSLLAAATSLGAGPVDRFVKVILPMSLPSLMTGFILVFVPVGGAFVEAEVLGGPSGQLLGNVIADQLTVTNNPYFGASLSVVLLLGILAVVGFLQLATSLARSHRGSA